jgi:acyl carrier protein
MSAKREGIREFISREIMLEQGPSSVTEQTVLVGGVLDSLGLMQLVSYIQEEFGLRFDDSEVSPENFRTVRDVERLVSEKIEAGDGDSAATRPQEEANRP